MGKKSDFFCGGRGGKHYFKHIRGFPGNGIYLLFFSLQFSKTYNVRLTNIICVGLPHRFNVFFLAFFMTKNSCILTKNEKHNT